jgi:hypothetical protein
VAGLGICLMDCSLVGLLDFLIKLYLVIVLRLVSLLFLCSGCNSVKWSATQLSEEREGGGLGMSVCHLSYLRRFAITGNVRILFSSFSFLNFFSFGSVVLLFFVNIIDYYLICID